MHQLDTMHLNRPMQNIRIVLMPMPHMQFTATHKALGSLLQQVYTMQQKQMLWTQHSHFVVKEVCIIGTVDSTIYELSIINTACMHVQPWCRPGAQWQDLNLQQLQEYLLTSGIATQLLFSVQDISDILIQWAHHKYWKDVFSEKDEIYCISLIGKHQLDMLEGSHESLEEICHACASYYIRYYPGPTERFMEVSTHKGREATLLNALNPYPQSKGV